MDVILYTDGSARGNQNGPGERIQPGIYKDNKQ